METVIYSHAHKGVILNELGHAEKSKECFDKVLNLLEEPETPELVKNNFGTFPQLWRC